MPNDDSYETSENHVHFIVNLDTATQSKLRVGAKLLALAHVINHNEAAR